MQPPMYPCRRTSRSSSAAFRSPDFTSPSMDALNRFRLLARRVEGAQARPLRNCCGTSCGHTLSWRGGESLSLEFLNVPRISICNRSVPPLQREDRQTPCGWEVFPLAFLHHVIAFPQKGQRLRPRAPLPRPAQRPPGRSQPRDCEEAPVAE